MRGGGGIDPVQMEVVAMQLLYQSIVEAVVELKMAIRVIMKKKLHKANINFLSIMMGEFDDYLPEDKQCAIAAGFKFQKHLSVIYCLITG